MLPRFRPQRKQNVVGLDEISEKVDWRDVIAFMVLGARFWQNETLAVKRYRAMATRYGYRIVITEQ